MFEYLNLFFIFANRKQIKNSQKVELFKIFIIFAP